MRATDWNEQDYGPADDNYRELVLLYRSVEADEKRRGQELNDLNPKYKHAIVKGLAVKSCAAILLLAVGAGAFHFFNDNDDNASASPYHENTDAVTMQISVMKAAATNIDRNLNLISLIRGSAQDITAEQSIGLKELRTDFLEFCARATSPASNYADPDANNYSPLIKIDPTCRSLKDDESLILAGEMRDTAKFLQTEVETQPDFIMTPQGVQTVAAVQKLDNDVREILPRFGIRQDTGSMQAVQLIR